MISKIDFIKNNKSLMNRKKEYKSEHDSHIFKVIGCGKSAFKILWFGNIPGSTRLGWNDAFWNYKYLDDISQDVIAQVYNDIKKAKNNQGGQTTL